MNFKQGDIVQFTNEYILGVLDCPQAFNTKVVRYIKSTPHRPFTITKVSGEGYYANYTVDQFDGTWSRQCFTPYIKPAPLLHEELFIL